MVALAAVVPGGDAEQQTGAFFSLLHNFLPESPVAAVEPPNLDVAVCHAMESVLAMLRNRSQANRMSVARCLYTELTKVRRDAEAAGAGSPAALAQATVELVFNVIAGREVPAAYTTALPLGPRSPGLARCF